MKYIFLASNPILNIEANKIVRTKCKHGKIKKKEYLGTIKEENYRKRWSETDNTSVNTSIHISFKQIYPVNDMEVDNK